MDYLIFSLVPVVTFLGWLLWVRWDSGRYLNQRRIERRLTDYPLRGTEDELLLLQMIDEANPRPEFRAQQRERWMAGYTGLSDGEDLPNPSSAPTQTGSSTS